MKTPTLFSLPLETNVALRNRAHAVRATYSDLADMFIRFGLEKISEGQLKAWASAQKAAKGQHPEGLTKHEQVVMSAFDGLLKGGEGAWRFDHKDIAQAAGLTAKFAYMALRKLEQRGLIKGACDAECDRFGRPVTSYWWLPASTRLG